MKLAALEQSRLVDLTDILAVGLVSAREFAVLPEDFEPIGKVVRMQRASGVAIFM